MRRGRELRKSAIIFFFKRKKKEEMNVAICVIYRCKSGSLFAGCLLSTASSHCPCQLCALCSPYIPMPRNHFSVLNLVVSSKDGLIPMFDVAHCPLRVLMGFLPLYAPLDVHRSPFAMISCRIRCWWLGIFPGGTLARRAAV